MSNNLMWRFPTVKGGTTSGLTTGDKETFKKNPYSSLAREILQNSIDVGVMDDKPVIVEFSDFEISTNEIPDIDGLKEQITRCKKLWNHKPDYCDVYEKMENALSKKTISCLRISDYNTSGLRGIRSDKLDGNRFIALTKGSGVSEKGSTNAGGSKGVGKNAALEQSLLDLLFYVTITDENEKGTIGVANFVSGFSKEHPEDRSIITQGAGYFTDNENNNAIDKVVSFDKNYSRGNQTGTDIYIIGFRGNHDKWEKEVISSVVDSFLVAIYKERLVVKINNIEISKKNIDNIILKEDYITDKNIKNNAVCNLRILKGGDDVKVFSIDTDYGTPTLYVLPLLRKEEDLATHACSMIRYPYMKIRNFKQNSNYRVAAMCVIDDDKLCKFLRNIENPEHTDWQPNRLDTSLKLEANALINSIKQQISDRIQEVLKIGGEDSIDPNKAGEFLPSIDEGGDSGESSGEEIKGTEEASRISNVVNVNLASPKAGYETDDDGDSLEPDVGDNSGEGDDPHPEGHNGGEGGEPRAGGGSGKVEEGSLVVLKNTDKSQIRYKFITINKDVGEYRIVFVAPIKKEECYLVLNLLDDQGNRTPIEIEKMSIDEKEIISNSSIKYGPFAIETNQKIKIELKTSSQNGMFGSEVKVLCK